MIKHTHNSGAKVFNFAIGKFRKFCNFCYLALCKLFKIDTCEPTVAEKILVVLAKSAHDVTNNFYIECGANDGFSSSNTYLLERMGWSGLLIEPSPVAYAKLIENRSEKNYFSNCALVSNDSVKYVTGDFDGSLMSSIDSQRTKRHSKIAVPAKTLQSLIEEHGVTKIDFFSLDVEGYEYEVLMGLDFAKNSPRYILCEVYDKDRDRIFELLRKHNYALPINLSNFNKLTHPIWDGTHNDYLFELQEG